MDLFLHKVKPETCTEVSETAAVEPEIQELLARRESVTIKEEPAEIYVKDEPIEDTEVCVKQEQCFTCHVCDYSSESVEELDKHIQIHSEEKYVCDVCSFRNKHALVLMRHMKKHSQVEQHKCDECGFTTRHQADFKIHLEAHFYYSCDHCDFKCLSDNELARHKESHKLKCDLCSYETFGHDRLQVHLAAYAVEQKVRLSCIETESTCKLCSFHSDDRAEFNKHIRSHCVREPFACHLCDYISLHQADLIRHLHIIHHVKGDRSSMRNHVCNYCTHKFKTYADLCVHVECTHNRSKIKLMCDICDSKHKTMYALNLHKKKEHALSWKESYYQKCNLCNYKTSIIQLLIKHKQKHHQGYYKCEVCDFKTMQYRQLRTHLLLQHKIVIIQAHCLRDKSNCPIKCRLCTFKCATPKGLRLHMYQVHNKPLKCAICSFKCKLIENIIQHIKHSHGNDPTNNTIKKVKKSNHPYIPYLCGSCTFKGSYLVVKSHISLVHKIKVDKKWRCDICDLIFNYSYKYKNHMERHKTDEPTPCSQCDFIGKNPLDLKLHKRKHRVGNLYYCSYCDYTRSKKTIMMAHIQSMHQNKLKMKRTTTLKIKEERLIEDSSS